MKKIIALGFFDGVHLGHQALLKECCRLAKALNCETAAITFDAHPQSLFLENPPALINTAQDRRFLLLHYGIDHVYTFSATKEVMSTKWAAFLEQLLEDGAAGFVCGKDFRFGCRGEGNAERLEEFCRMRDMPCIIVQDQMLDGTRISSTHIRTLLEAGEMERAVRFLGHPHVLTGTVVPGRHLGRTIGIPTANLELPEEVVQLRRGVYVCRARLEEESFPAVTNVGTRPTVGGSHVTVEPWLLDFDRNLYGKTLTLEFYSYLRPEVKFPSLEALREEIQKNALEVRKFFDKN